jgi:hypothetical protein
MRNPLRVGIVLIAIGVAGLFILGALDWGGPPGPWRHGPMSDYEFFCSVSGHRDVGMFGRIIVTP